MSLFTHFNILSTKYYSNYKTILFASRFLFTPSGLQWDPGPSQKTLMIYFGFVNYTNKCSQIYLGLGGRVL